MNGQKARRLRKMIYGKNGTHNDRIKIYRAKKLQRNTKGALGNIGLRRFYLDLKRKEARKARGLE